MASQSTSKASAGGALCSQHHCLLGLPAVTAMLIPEVEPPCWWRNDQPGYPAELVPQRREMLNLAAALALGSLCAQVPRARAATGELSCHEFQRVRLSKLQVALRRAKLPWSCCRLLTSGHKDVSADARQALLDAIKAKEGDNEVISALRELAKQNPTSSPAKSQKIFGEWNLLWASENAEARPQLP